MRMNVTSSDLSWNIGSPSSLGEPLNKRSCLSVSRSGSAVLSAANHATKRGNHFQPLENVQQQEKNRPMSQKTTERPRMSEEGAQLSPALFAHQRLNQASACLCSFIYASV